MLIGVLFVLIEVVYGPFLRLLNLAQSHLATLSLTVSGDLRVGREGGREGD